jgi:RNA polymerase sigma-70 factor (ECF subfamily)
MEELLFDEKAALAAARKGDRAAFGGLVRAYQRRAYAVAYSFVRNRDDALELSQEGFVRAFRSMSRFNAEMPFYPWLYRIIRNACLNHLKKKRRHGETSLDRMMESGYDARELRRGPSESAELGDLKEAIGVAMAQLTPDQREILRLRHFLELSYAEIAECLEIPQGTVMSRLHGARKGLRRVLETTAPEVVPGTAGESNGARNEAANV